MVADARVGCPHTGQQITNAEGEDADALRVYAWPMLQELEGLHHSLAVPRRDLVVKERRRPDIDDDNALARKRLQQVDELGGPRGYRRHLARR